MRFWECLPHRFRTDGVHHVQRHQCDRQQLQGQARLALGRPRAGQCHQGRFAHPIQASCAPRMIHGRGL